jgi:hypothetical protein
LIDLPNGLAILLAERYQELERNPDYYIAVAAGKFHSGLVVMAAAKPC